MRRPELVKCPTITVNNTVNAIRSTWIVEESAKRNLGRLSRISLRNITEFFLSPDSSSKEMRRSPTSEICEKAASTAAKNPRIRSKPAATIISISIMWTWVNGRTVSILNQINRVMDLVDQILPASAIVFKQDVRLFRPPGSSGVIWKFSRRQCLPDIKHRCDDPPSGLDHIGALE